MSLVIFPCRFLSETHAPYDEPETDLQDAGTSSGGRFAAVARAQDSQIGAVGTIRLPQTVAGTVYRPSDLRAFRKARQGMIDTFLWLAEWAEHREVEHGAVGTGTGSETVFAFSDGTDLHKHLVNGDHDDAVTLKIYVAGVLKTLTTHYAVTLNDSDPTLTFTAGVTGAVTASYRHYLPMRFSSPAFETTTLRRRGDDSLADGREPVIGYLVEMAEDFPGARFAGTT